LNAAIIPARGGSKRIPKKNIRPFAGKPIIAYSIEAAQTSGLFERIIVSTDDDEIADVARLYGAEIPFIRPKELADDHTGTHAVVKHAIQWLRSQGSIIENICCIYATAPFIQATFLVEGYQKLIASGKSYAFSVTSFPFPILRSVRITPTGSIEPIFPENIFKRSQDLEESYHDAGQFYWGTEAAYMNDTVLYSSASIPVVLPRCNVQDIDTCEDWQRAELMFEAWKRSREMEQ
jgi:pseudaminic acid cytidylyltransferase